MIIFAFSGCEENKGVVQSEHEIPINEIEKKRAEESYIKFKTKHDEIAKHIAAYPESIPEETWVDLLENSKPISHFQLDEMFDETYNDDKGKEYKFMIEIYSGSNINNPNEFRVSIDPDRFF